LLPLIGIILIIFKYKEISIDFYAGHAAYDEIIRETGRSIKSLFWEMDIAGLIGGEDLPVALKNASLDVLMIF